MSESFVLQEGKADGKERDDCLSSNRLLVLHFSTHHLRHLKKTLIYLIRNMHIQLICTLKKVNFSTFSVPSVLFTHQFSLQVLKCVMCNEMSIFIKNRVK